MRKRSAKTLSARRRSRLVSTLHVATSSLRCASNLPPSGAGCARRLGPLPPDWRGWTPRLSASPCLSSLRSSSGRFAPSGPSALRATPCFTGCAPPLRGMSLSPRRSGWTPALETGGRAFRGRRGSAPHDLTAAWAALLPVGRTRSRLPPSPTPAAGASGDRRGGGAPAPCPIAHFFWSPGFAGARPAPEKMAMAPLRRCAAARFACPGCAGRSKPSQP